MNPGPQLHRSLTFWAGLLVILSICWASWDSGTHISALLWKQVMGGNTRHGLYILRVPSWKSELLLERDPQPPPPPETPHQPFFQPPFLVSWTAEDKTPPPSKSQLQWHEQLRVHRLGPGSWALYLPYWLILLPLLLTWIALLFLRARRRKHSATHAPS